MKPPGVHRKKRKYSIHSASVSKKKHQNAAIDDDVVQVKIVPKTSKKASRLEARENFKYYQIIPCESSKHKFLVIQPGHSVTFQGCLEILPVQGSIKVRCTSLDSFPSLTDDNWKWLCAPNNISAPITLKCPPVDLENSNKLVISRLKNRVKDLCSPDAWQCLSAVVTPGSVVSLVRSRLSPSCLSVRSLLPHCFPKQTAKAAGVFLQYASIVTQPGKLYPQEVVNAFDQTMDIVNHRLGEGKTTVIFVCGPKNSGKSTLVRCLVNLLLQEVANVYHLEADVGQPEFTPPGCLALTKVTQPILTPPFAHLETEFEDARFFGDISPADRQTQYLETVGELFECYIRKTEGVSSCLVVNSHGWIEGPGLELHKKMLERLCVDCILQCSSKDCTPLSDNHVPPQSILLTLPPIVNELPGGLPPPKHLRCSSIVSYFSPLFPCGDLNALYDIRPLVISLHSISLWFAFGSVPIEHIMSVMNAALVALCVAEENELSNCHIHKEGNLSIRLSSTVSPPKCIGYGIIRAIDMEKGLLYLITPVPLNSLQSVNLIAKGAVDLPDVFFFRQSTIQPCPYVLEAEKEKQPTVNLLGAIRRSVDYNVKARDRARKN